MPGLSSLKVNIKDQPHNLAWINKAEQDLLKDLGGSGRPGPMGIPAYPYDDFDDPEGIDDPNPDDETPTNITEEQSRAAVAEQLGLNYDPESLATPSFMDALGNTIDVPSYGLDSQGNWGEIEDIGGSPQGAFATSDQHAKYFFGPKDGGPPKTGPGGLVKYSEVPEGIKIISPIGFMLMSALDKASRNVHPHKEQGTKSNISFYTPEDPMEDYGDEEVVVEEEVEEVEEETPPLTAMEQYFKDREDGATTAIDETNNIVERLGIQNRTIEPFNEWLAGQSEAMRAADMTTQTNKYRESLRDQTSAAESYLPLVAPIRDRETEQRLINNLYGDSSKRTSATQALFDELGI
jgi:hypothetical protein